MKNWIQLFKREFGLFKTNSVVMAIFIGAPLAYGLLFGAVYQKGKVTNLPVLVIDMDQSPLSNKLIDMLDDNETVVPHVVHSKSNIQQQIIDYQYGAIVTIPLQFEAGIIQKRHPEIEVDVNTANILTANYAAKAMQVVLGTLNAGIEIEGLKKKGVPNTIAKTQYEAFKVSYIKFFNSSANYMSFLWPGMLGVIVQQVFLLAMALSFAREFEQGTFATEFMPKAKNVFNAILLKSLPFWLMGIGVLALLKVMFGIFRVPLHVDTIAAIALLGSLILSVTFLGVLASIAIPNQLKATEILMVIATPSFVLSGFTWPLSQMPTYVVIMAKAIPLTHFLEGLRNIMLYNANLGQILPQVKANLWLALLFGTLSILLLYFKSKKLAKTVN